MDGCDTLLAAAQEVVDQYDGLTKKFSSISRMVPGLKGLDDGPIERLRRAVQERTASR